MFYVKQCFSHSLSVNAKFVAVHLSEMDKKHGLLGYNMLE